MVKTIHANVRSPDATVLQLKQKIHNKKGIPIHEMQLWLQNQQLEDHKPLNQYAIGNGSNLELKIFRRSEECPCPDCQLMEKEVTINVTSLSKSFKVTCTLGKPVENLKRLIQKKEKIPVSRQKLVFKNQTLEDHKQLATYKLVDEETGEREPVVQLLVDSGTATLIEKLRNMVSFKKLPSPNHINHNFLYTLLPPSPSSISWKEIRACEDRHLLAHYRHKIAFHLRHCDDLKFDASCLCEQKLSMKTAL